MHCLVSLRRSINGTGPQKPNKVFSLANMVLSLNKTRGLRGLESRVLAGRLVVPPVPLLLELLDVFPLGPPSVPLPLLFPVPHLFTVLIQAEAGAAEQLDVVLVPEPRLCQQVPRPALLVLRFLRALHLPALDDVEVELHDGLDKRVLLGFAIIGSRVSPLQAADQQSVLGFDDSFIWFQLLDRKKK